MASKGAPTQMDAGQAETWFMNQILNRADDDKARVQLLLRALQGMEQADLEALVGHLLQASTPAVQSVVVFALGDGLTELLWNAQVEDYVRRLANSEDWAVRETAQLALKSALEGHFEQVLPVVETWAKDANPNIRRAAMLGCRPKPREPEANVRRMLDVVTSLVGDDAPYVRRNVPYALRFYRRYPGLVLPRLQVLASSEDPIVQENVAQACEGTLAKTQPAEVLTVLKELARSSEAATRRWVIKALQKVEQEHAGMVGEALREWRQNADLAGFVEQALTALGKRTDAVES